MREILKVAYKTKTPYFLSGATGIGKTVGVKELAIETAKEEDRKFIEWNNLTRDEKHEVLKNAEKYFGFIDQRALQFDLGEFKLPKFNDSDGTFEWCIPLVYQYLCNPKTKAILFFDEFNLAPSTIQGMFYQIINDKQIGEHKISDGVFVIGAGNRLEDKAFVYTMAVPLQDRFEHLELAKPPLEEWVEWALPHKIDNRLIGFLYLQPSELWKYEEDSTDMAFPTHRGHERCSDMIKEIPTKSDNYDLLEKIIGSNLGEAYAGKFIAWLRKTEKIKIADFLENPKLIKEINDMDLKYAICVELPTMFKKENKLFPKIMKLIELLEPELAIMTLRFMKEADSKYFSTNAIKFNFISKYGKYLL